MHNPEPIDLDAIRDAEAGILSAEDLEHVRAVRARRGTKVRHTPEQLEAELIAALDGHDEVTVAVIQCELLQREISELTARALLESIENHGSEGDGWR